jgi:hypothetical protein
MYHLDGDALIATHYCPAGNQPTLQLRADLKTGLVFEFRSATNLARAADSHQHRFEIRFLDDRHFWRSETYRGDGEEATEAVTYTGVDETLAPERRR